MESDSQSLCVFDGTNDFLVWRARVESELMRCKLLGFALVSGYDGTQSFPYKGQVVPPKCEDRLGSWDVLMEAGDAMGVLRRYLKPSVESAIVEMNIYDCWASLNAIYGSGRDPATRSISEMYRVLQHMFFGDKAGESMSEFIARWEMLVQQYVTITGVQLTDPARSAMFEYAMPRPWREDMKQWTGSRLFIPFAELVERVVAKADHANVKFREFVVGAGREARETLDGRHRRRHRCHGKLEIDDMRSISRTTETRPTDAASLDHGHHFPAPSAFIRPRPRSSATHLVPVNGADSPMRDRGADRVEIDRGVGVLLHARGMPPRFEQALHVAVVERSCSFELQL